MKKKLKRSQFPDFVGGLSKLTCIMKLTFILILLNVCVAFSSTYSQQTKFTLSGQNVSIRDVLSNIESKSEFRFFFNSELINLNQRVNYNIEEGTISQLLDQVLLQNGIQYEVKDRTIILSPKSSNEPGIAAQQQRSVSGKVTDSSGAPMPGVTVAIKGTSQGTITDTNGGYSFSKVPADATLIFSFVGMKTQEVKIAGKTSLNIILEEETIGIEEVISIGYGSMKKSDLTGSIARVNMEEKALQANTNVLAALSGITAGVNIDQSGEKGGLAGEAPVITIRGQTSLSASQDPLIVLDGVIYSGNITNINVNDVESIDVLKDASAAAVYGARSANGVILITTKKGTTEKPTVSFDMYYGYQDMTNNKMKVMDAEQYAIKYVDYYYQQGLYKWYATHPTDDAGRPAYPDINNKEVIAGSLRYQEERDNYLAGKSVDWVKQVLRTAPIQNYNLSFSGKSQHVNYFISGSYTGEDGILKNDQFSRITVRSNLESKITDWLTLTFNSSYSYLDYSGRPASLSDARVASPLANNIPFGQPGYQMYLLGEAYQQYPLANIPADDMDHRNNLFFLGSAKITVPWIKGLSYQLNYSNDYTFNKSATFYPTNTPDGAKNGGKATTAFSDTRHWLLDNIVTYLRTFGDHQINVTLLYTADEYHNTNANLSAEGFSDQTLGYNAMGLGTLNRTATTGASKSANLAYMGRLNYSYKNRYLLTGTVRRDGYSGFGADKKFGVFPSASLGWVLPEEPFLNGRNFPYLKLRLSYGVNGNQGLGAYNSLAQIATIPYVYGSTTVIGYYPSTLENADLGWEKTASTNIGLDYAFLDHRISGSIEAYKAKTTGVLVERTLSSPTGYSKVWTNLGGLDNKGIELQLTTINFKGINGAFHWETNFSFSENRNKITKLYDNLDQDIGNSWFVGEPIKSVYDLEMTGKTWQESDLFSGNILANWYPGQIQYVDQGEGDGVINADDRKIIGYKEPRFRFSINNTLSWKNFTLNFYVNSVQGGNHYYILNAASYLNVGGTDHTLRENITAVRPYWTPLNQVNGVTGVYSAAPASGGIYQDRSFVRLQNVTLSYKLPPRILHMLEIKSAQVFVSGKNLYTWTKWPGWDPETAEGSASNYPSMRNVTVGVKLSL